MKEPKYSPEVEKIISPLRDAQEKSAQLAKADEYEKASESWTGLAVLLFLSPAVWVMFDVKQVIPAALASSIAAYARGHYLWKQSLVLRGWSRE